MAQKKAMIRQSIQAGPQDIVGFASVIQAAALEQDGNTVLLIVGVPAALWIDL